MRKITAYRLKGTLLAIIVLALGITGTVVLYTAGEKGFQFFYDNRLDYEPKFDSFKSALTNGWTVGFVYILVSITAVAASMSCLKGLVILHLVADIVSLILGSFLHTSSAAALVVLLLLGRYEFYTSCAFQLRYGGMGEDDMSADHRCIVARETVQLTVAAIVVLAITWLFVLIDLLFHALNYSFVASIKRSNDHLDQETAVIPEPSQSHLHQEAAVIPEPSQSHLHQGAAVIPEPSQSHLHQGAAVIPKPSQSHLHQEAAVIHEPSQSHLHQETAVTPGPSQSHLHQETAVTPGPSQSHLHQETAVTPGPSQSHLHQETAVTPGPSQSHLHQETAVTQKPCQSHLHQGAAVTPGLSQSPIASGTDTPPQENMDHGTTYDEIQLQTLDKDEPVSQNVPGTQNAAPNKEGEDKKQRH